ncbi:MAG: beta-N-acetylhexosaminidase [Armatimonadetes bacterium]|nr:beta-N-acetylhexosaminidase [Armatimonadota bacterium]
MIQGKTTRDYTVMGRDMSLEEKIGQLFIVDIVGRKITGALFRHFQRFKWGGVILFSRNIGSPHQVREFVSLLQQLAKSESPRIPLLVAIDQEGGAVSHLTVDMALSPGNMSLGATGSPYNAYRAARISGQELRALGINVNLAPVLDVNNNPRNPIIGIRSFGESPELVSELGVAAIRGYREAGIIATAKHFPGHGDTSVDSHLALPCVPHDRERLEAMELPPFAAAVKAGVEAVMTAHITFPKLDGHRPATASKPILTGILREHMGFKGLIVTDSMSMRGMTSYAPSPEACVQALEAGADLLLLCGSAKHQYSCFQAVLSAVRAGRITEARIGESLDRVLSVKSRYSLDAAPLVSAEEKESFKNEMLNITRDSVTLVKNENGLLPLRLKEEEKLLLIRPTFHARSLEDIGRLEAIMKRFLQSRHSNVKELTYNLLAQRINLASVRKEALDARAVLLFVFARAELPKAQKEIVKALVKMRRPPIVVSLLSPYVLDDIPEISTYLCAYNFRENSILAILEVLFGEVEPKGKLPITLPGLFQRGHGLVGWDHKGASFQPPNGGDTREEG